MAPISIIASTLVLIASVTSCDASHMRNICGNYDCPPFMGLDLDKNNSIEVRNMLHPTYWAETSVLTSEVAGGQLEGKKMFMKLFRYIRGGNAEVKQMKMTVPVLKKVEHSFPGLYKKTMMFFIGGRDVPPVPLDKTVRIITMPQATGFIVKSFFRYGYPPRHSFQKQLAQLCESVGNDVPHEGYSFYQASYQNPKTPGLKRYEVWVQIQVKK